MQLYEHAALGSRTTLGVGGNARFLVEAQSEDEIVEALSWAEQRGLCVRVLGGGSNLVVSDSGFEGLVIAVALRGLSFSSAVGDARLTVAAGEPWDLVVERAVVRGLAGLEGLSGIPGSAGATPIQNVGAYGQEVAESIVAVRAIDRQTKKLVELSAAECRFAYRDSFFKAESPERFVVTAVVFELSARPPLAPRYPDLKRELERRNISTPSLSELRASVLAVRGEKSMLLDRADPNGRSCGSFFLNPVVTFEQAELVRRRATPAEDPSAAAAHALTPATSGPPTYPQPDGRVKLAAGWLIEQSGFGKGFRDGNVGLSTKHALAIVAHAGARASDVRRLSQRIQEGVARRFDVQLTPEPSFWGE